MTVAASIDPHTIPVLQAAAQALQLLAEGWRRQPVELRDCDEYAPDVVRFWLTGGHWRILDEGPTSTKSGAVGTGGDPLGLAHIKSDLEWATDQALTDMLHWQSVARIYKRQQRWAKYLDLRAQHFTADRLESEPWMQPNAEAICFERIARQLGWQPPAC